MLSKRKTLIFLILSQLVYLMFSISWLVVLGISAYLFRDSGDVNPGIRGLFAYLQAYPGGLLLGLILGWTFFAKGKYKQAVWWNLLPLLWVVPFIGIIIYANIFA
ncbi:hypothetical protein IM700_005750 [Paenibacillus sp. DXFW5]|jgi:hypothetical protein|uniref:Uncharacterized protein n=1 Tax=Paenibacillus rhizolycopersici TaxID=2780073 RepID=A0ABS2H6M8_9BACL|nr:MULTISPECIES: hypothetical protein [Paenibacillus]MBM6995164.1 hypothetical protein [Paenibacillus rhizolycopersici]GIP46760.1 hypothetical protein J53TS2_03510 [Paenibacillus sp. J53TS2]